LIIWLRPKTWRTPTQYEIINRRQSERMYPARRNQDQPKPKIRSSQRPSKINNSTLGRNASPEWPSGL